jgi:aminopeptidase YwaD
MFHRLKVLSLLVVMAVSCLHTQTVTSDISAERIKAHIRYLASDELEGRMSGAPGNVKAASYIAKIMQSSGLRPAGDSGTFFQSFEFVSAVKLGAGNALAFDSQGVPAMHISLRPDVDFRPFGFSSNASVTGPLVFVGYGISAPDAKYDDYANLDVTGKVVVMLRYSPEGNDPRSELNRFSQTRNKARIARDKGAAAMIMVTGPNDDSEDDLIKLAHDHSFSSAAGIPAVSVKRSVLEPLIKAEGYDLKTIQDSIKASRKPLSFSFKGINVDLQTDILQVMARTSNVAGYLEGYDPKLKDQVITIGAHFDHLGYGGPGSGSMAPDTVAIHHGADDNASGTAGLLELIHTFSGHPDDLKRSILFLAFTGEELGTLGSTYYVNHPFLPLEHTVLMVNLDMIGRLDHKALTVYGAGTSPEWPGLLAKENADSSFALIPIQDGYGPSDQSVFYAKDLPVLFFFTGTHPDYHKPADEWQKINYAGEERIVRYVYDIVKDVQAQPDRPAFTKAQSSAPMGGGESRGYRVSLWIVPDFGETKDGMKIGGIRPDGPAEKAGLKAGDIIVKMAGKKVTNIYDYMGVLSELKVGDVVEVMVLREGKSLTVSATMQKTK